jgi:hypothetical protein
LRILFNRASRSCKNGTSTRYVWSWCWKQSYPKTRRITNKRSKNGRT